METLVNIGRIGFGLLFLVGAVFNLAYTFNHGDVFFGSFEKNAWFPLSRTLVREFVIPQAKVATVAIVLVQVTAAILILSGIFVETGLIIGAIFAFAAALVSSPGGTIGNLVLGVLQVLLTFAN